MATGVSSVYLNVVEAVVGKLREEFLNEGVDDTVLTELQTTPMQTPMQTPMLTPLPADTPGHPYFSGSSDYAATPDIGGGPFTRSPYLPQQSPWTNQRPLGVDVNVAYEEAREQDEVIGSGSRPVNNAAGLPPAPQAPIKDFFTSNTGKRKRDDYALHFRSGGYIPQHDGSGDVTENSSSHWKNALSIPQSDGFPDNYDEGVRHEDYSTPSYYAAATPTAPNIGTPKPKSEVQEDDEPPLNEDDDDHDELDDLEGEELQNTNHLVLAQFEKVNRTKSRWKCTLKDGIMHLNNKDILFTKANGEFDF